MLVPSPDSDIVEPPLDVKFGEDSTFREAVQDFTNERKRVGILYSNLVQFLIINNGPEFVPFIFEEQGGHVWRVTRVDAS